jgi:hypothetical protein
LIRKGIRLQNPEDIVCSNRDIQQRQYFFGLYFFRADTNKFSTFLVIP